MHSLTGSTRRTVGSLVAAVALAVFAAPMAQAVAPATTPGPGKKCYSFEEYDVKYWRGDEWVCVKVGKSWQNKYMWVLYE